MKHLENVKTAVEALRDKRRRYKTIDITGVSSIADYLLLQTETTRIS